MTLRLISGVVLTVALTISLPAFAKTKKNTSSGAITGVYCSQGPENIHFPASSIKASIRNKLRKGQKFKFNYPGYGPIDCKAY